MEKLPLLSSQVIFCPVTTRSIEQFERIRWPEGIHMNCAVVSNGGNLLRGEVDFFQDREWRDESERLVMPCMEELEHLHRRYSTDPDFIRCRIVDDTYLFTYCAPGVDVAEKTAEVSRGCKVNVISSGKKIYFFPEGIDKGTDIKRLKKRLGADYVICAGDSTIDIPMLNEADAALVPDAMIADEVKRAKVMMPGYGIRFPDFVVRKAAELINGNSLQVKDL
jgi:hydroxymethylpyrimidine pyrophosphatase-like HAD family hydrolase